MNIKWHMSHYMNCCVFLMHQSIPALNIQPPRQPPGIRTKSMPGGLGFQSQKMPKGLGFRAINFLSDVSAICSIMSISVATS